MKTIIPLVAPAIGTLTREDIEASPEGRAYLVPMTAAAVVQLMERKGMDEVDVIAVDVSPDGRTIVFTETARLG